MIRKMSEKQPFYVKPLIYSIKTQGIKERMLLDFSDNIRRPRVTINGQSIRSKLIVDYMQHQSGTDGVVPTRHVKLSFIEPSLEKRIEVSLMEYSRSLFTSIFILGNFGVVPTRETELKLIKETGFSIKMGANEQPLKTAQGYDVIDPESTYDKVTIERNSSSFTYFFQMLWLINKIKKIEKLAKR